MCPRWWGGRGSAAGLLRAYRVRKEFGEAAEYMPQGHADHEEDVQVEQHNHAHTHPCLAAAPLPKPNSMPHIVGLTCGISSLLDEIQKFATPFYFFGSPKKQATGMAAGMEAVFAQMIGKSPVAPSSGSSPPASRTLLNSMRFKRNLAAGVEKRSPEKRTPTKRSAEKREKSALTILNIGSTSLVKQVQAILDGSSSSLEISPGAFPAEYPGAMDEAASALEELFKKVTEERGCQLRQITCRGVALGSVVTVAFARLFFMHTPGQNAYASLSTNQTHTGKIHRDSFLAVTP